MQMPGACMFRQHWTEISLFVSNILEWKQHTWNTRIWFRKTKSGIILSLLNVSADERCYRRKAGEYTR